jgi:hypothetical protein
LLLLTACGQAGSSANNSVTVDLPAAGPPVPPDSSYTPLEGRSCKAIEGSQSRRCDGPAGYSLVLGPDVLAVIDRDGRRSEIDLSRLAAKRPSHKLGAKAEWRSPAPGHPTALIVRIGGDLAVARLKYPACVVALVEPQPRQNENAREIADGKLPACLSR